MLEKKRYINMQNNSKVNARNNITFCCQHHCTRLTVHNNDKHLRQKDCRNYYLLAYGTSLGALISVRCVGQLDGLFVIIP